ncbi:MAG: division/cell wall cluster transcriptional repressor MraZ [Ferruginibacter sp.]
MLELLGDFEVTLDAKGRFLLPAAIKKELEGETANQFVINKGLDMEPCLTLWPKQTWTPIYSKLISMNDFEPKVRHFKYKFLDGITNTELDSAGRILVPKFLIDHAKLEKDLILKALGDKIQIWDKNGFRKFIDSITDDTSELGREVMGDKRFNPQPPLPGFGG